jgi:hypothetical protein
MRSCFGLSGCLRCQFKQYREAKLRPFAQFAGYVYGAVVKLYQTLGYRQAQAGATIIVIDNLFFLYKRIEDNPRFSAAMPMPVSVTLKVSSICLSVACSFCSTMPTLPFW